MCNLTIDKKEAAEQLQQAFPGHDVVLTTEERFRPSSTVQLVRRVAYVVGDTVNAIGASDESWAGAVNDLVRKTQR